ncbi:MAG: PT domain-containing protein [Eubacteriales bacterium]
MKKRILGIALAICMMIFCVPMGVFAESAADVWDGSADTSWYTSAPDASEYHISTAEQLAGLAQLVNADPGTTNFAGKTFYLDNDLDLSGHEWISIGTVLGGDCPEYSFCGVFDGQGHVISNLYSHESDIEGADESHNLLRNALFGSVYNGEVKNLGVADAEIWIDPKDDSAAGKGILVDWMGKSKITNCWTSGSIYSGTKTEKNIGGIVGITMQGCTISGCYSTATLTGNFTNSEGYYKNPDPATWPCDTIGGIVGARFDGSLTVTDCWFDGKIVVNSIQAAVGGIVGCTATVNNSVGGSVGDADIAIKNCMVTTTDMGVDKDGNTCWVAYALSGTVENCYWPNDTKYGPSPLASGEGTAVTDFTSADVLAGLKNNAGAGVEWVAGINHPTFSWDSRNIPADYTAVNDAIASAEAIDGSLYANYGDVEAAINNVDRSKNKMQQADVDAMAQAIENAITALQYKDADYTKVDEAIAKANALNKDAYTNFTAVEEAINAVVRDKNITEQDEVDAMAKAIEDAMAALEKKPAVTPTPTATPTAEPSASPTAAPTATPTATPTAAPSASPTAAPTATPTATPTAAPSASPTAVPTATPTVKPTATPSARPTAVPTATPTVKPTATPTPAPKADPNNPKTGSSNLPVVFGSAALVLSGGALAAVLIYKKKRHEK